MHINMSLSRDGRNIFQDSHDPNGLSQEAYYFLGGILKHIKGMTLILNPLVNSYKRLMPGYEAPTHIAWSGRNRTPLIRIPATRGEETRIDSVLRIRHATRIWHWQSVLLQVLTA